MLTNNDDIKRAINSVREVEQNALVENGLLKFYKCRVDVLQSQISLRSQISLAVMFVIQEKSVRTSALVYFFTLLEYPGGTPYNGLYGEAPGNFFRLQVYKRVGISQAEVYERVGKSVI